MQYLEIAKIINTHGIKGEVKVLCNYYGNNYCNWKVDQIIYLQDNNNYQTLTINTIRQHKNILLVSFKEYNNINNVLFMKNKSLAIDKKTANINISWLHQDLVGYQVVNSADRKVLGTVINLINNNHNGLWEIVDKDNKSQYVPNEKFFINKIDEINEILYLNIISGMFNYE